MSIRWYDVSIPLHAGTTVWPGDCAFQLTPASRIAEGSSCNTSEITCPTHIGTHCDAPWHFEDGGKRLHEIDTSVFFGDALILEVSGTNVISAEHLGEDPLPQRVLFKTGNSDYPADGPFHQHFTGLDASAAQRLVDDGVRLVGIDYLSIAPYKQSGPTHHILLQNDVFVVEGLRLAGFSAGTYPFVVLPMPLAGADGAPCRAFIGRP